MVKKKAAVCLLQLYRKYPDFITPDVWADRLIKLLSSRFTRPPIRPPIYESPHSSAYLVFAPKGTLAWWAA